jgi:Kdo2-lipid IVA lauroyltransferase/acyltransferase
VLRAQKSTGRKPAIAPGFALSRVAVGLVLFVVRLLPRATYPLLAGTVASLAMLLRIRWSVAVDNVTRAFPDKSKYEVKQVVRGAYFNLALSALDAVTSDLLPQALLESYIETVDWKGLDRRLAAGLPTLVASAHLGSWELFAEVMARRNIRMAAVVRPLRGAFNAWVVRNRTEAGVALILQHGALRGMTAALKDNKAVVQLIDQSLPAKHGVFVDFFGRPASTTPALSLVALRTGVPVYVTVSVRTPAGLKMFVEGPVPIEVKATREETISAHTQALTSILEGYIAQFPEQWLWLHRRWKEQPPSKKPS